MQARNVLSDTRRFAQLFLLKTATIQSPSPLPPKPTPPHKAQLSHSAKYQALL